MPRVLIADQLSPAAEAIFRERGLEVDTRVGLKTDELIAIIGDYDGLAVRSATKVTAEVLAAATRLKVVGRAGIGVDNIDVEAATQRGVVVMNTPFGNSVTTAEHAISLMLALARQIPAADRSTRAGRWEKNRFMGVELMGKALGLVGCGNIGSIVADRAQGLKMRVIAYDPFLSPERAADLNVEKVELDALLARADVITLHTPLTEQTRNILSRDNLMRTQPGVRIVNCARGGLVDEQAVADLIRRGHVAGAAFDVFAVEPAKDRRCSARRGDRHPASRRLDQRGAGERGASGGRADQRLSDHRRGRERAQHALGHRRGGAAAAALHEAGRAAGLVRGPAHRDRAGGGHRHLCRPRRLAQHPAADPGGAHRPAAARSSPASTWSTRRRWRSSATSTCAW